MYKLLIYLLLFSTMGSASTLSRITYYTTTWNGFVRYYQVRTPANLGANPALVVVLNPTTTGTAAQPPNLSFSKSWSPVADANNYILVWPVSTYNPRSANWYWSAQDLDWTFPAPTDDAGFVEWVTSRIQAQYAIPAAKTFLSGFSSGCFMAQRVAAEWGNNVAAVACAAGRQDAAQAGFTMPPAVAPVSVLIINGDADTIVNYCGATGLRWGEPKIVIPSLDENLAYWVANNGCSDRLPALCTNGQPTTGVNGADAINCIGNTEVRTLREVGVIHTWLSSYAGTFAQFFNTH